MMDERYYWSDNNVSLYLWDIYNGNKSIGKQFAWSSYDPNKGIMTRKVKKALMDLKREKELSEVFACIRKTNIASIRVAEKSGFEYCGSDKYSFLFKFDLST